MKNLTLTILSIFLLFGCITNKTTSVKEDDLTTFLTYDPVIQSQISFFSDVVKDTFNIFVSLPKDYDESDNTYPVVYILDANVAFDIISTIMKVQSNGLECKNAIYIGVGYKDIISMDSLRFRDYSFPPDLDGYGANVFSNFLDLELIPYINKEFRTQPDENIVIGHSLSGYFVMYNLLQSAIKKNPSFKGYIAGSAFIGNDSIFLNLENKLFEQTDTLPVKLFMCSGTIDDTDSMQIVFDDILKKRNYKGFEYKSIILNDFEHMDILFPTWTKGLRYMLRYN